MSRMHVKQAVILGLTLGLLYGMAVAERPSVRVFNTLEEFHAAAGPAVAVVDFERLPIGPLARDTYQDRGVVVRTSQSMQAHRTPLAPSLSIEEHVGAPSTKILISDAIPVAPNALTLQFPPGTKAAGCFLVAAAEEPGAPLQVEAQAADGSRRQVEIAAFAERNGRGPQRGPRRQPSAAVFIGFESESGIVSLAISAADKHGSPVYNFGVDTITFTRP